MGLVVVLLFALPLFSAIAVVAVKLFEFALTATLLRVGPLPARRSSS
jgi:hypothetical protein